MKHMGEVGKDSKHHASTINFVMKLGKNNNRITRNSKFEMHLAVEVLETLMSLETCACKISVRVIFITLCQNGIDPTGSCGTNLRLFLDMLILFKTMGRLIFSGKGLRERKRIGKKVSNLAGNKKNTSCRKFVWNFPPSLENFNHTLILTLSQVLQYV